jgi:EAL domain-containing protein (putative c-di-GMP-specific phosphodiesterase class I)
MNNLFNIQNPVQLGQLVESESTKETHNKASFLHNFLEPYESFINNLIKELSIINTSTEELEIQSFILNIIRLVSKADFVFILCNNNKTDDWSIKSHSDLSENINSDYYINTLNTIIFPTISQISIFNPAHHGIYKIHEDTKGISKGFLFIPIKSLVKQEIIVICDFLPEAYLLGDIYGRILSSFYQYSHEFKLQQNLVEAAILDDLKKDFGFVSASLYEKRFHLFRNRLQQMIVYFEPIIHLDPRELFISGWEALARNPQDSKAPSDLFHAAELWGPRFMIELDQYFLVLASKTYREALKKAKQNRPNEIVPLSVNVYPESLMRTAYYDKVREIIHDKVISPRHLILEISEKTEIPKFNNGIYINQPLQSFEKLLLRYVREFKIRFSIDDFGVGYASVSRLAGLNPSYVKIDREILYHEPTEVIIRFVHELVQANSLRDRTDVIVEGVDENTPISLRKLREIGVSYIQGYMVGKATSDIYRLTSEKADFFRNKLLQP